MSSSVTFCLRCGSALSEGSPFCIVCGAPVRASPPAAPVSPQWYGAPYPAQPYPSRAASGGHRSVAIVMIALGSIALVVALVGGMFVMVSGSRSGVSVTPESFSCASGNSRSIEFALPDLPQTTKLTITITNEQGSGVSSVSASVSDLSQHLQADGRYRIEDSGDTGTECGAGTGTFTYAIWNDGTKEKLLSGTFTVVP